MAWTASARCSPGCGREVVFGTEEEADLVGEVPGSEMVVKLGPRGVRIGGVTHPATPVHRGGRDRRR